jgi:hypothetical protein
MGVRTRRATAEFAAVFGGFLQASPLTSGSILPMFPSPQVMEGFALDPLGATRLNGRGV